jgi:hypothetical protein
METNLRPLTLGEILDRTAQLYRSNFLLFAGIFAVYSGVALVLNLGLIGLGEALKATHAAQQLKWILWTFTGLEMLVLFLLVGASVAAISRAVAWLHLDEPATIRGAYMSILPRLKRYLWLMTITAFFVWTPIALLYGAYFAVMATSIKGYGTFAGIANTQAAAAAPQKMMIVGLASLAFILLLFPVGMYTVFMSLRYALALPACVVENLKAREAIRRSIELSKGARGRIFVLWLLIGAIKIGLVLFTQIFIVVAAVKHRGQLGPGMTAASQVIAFFTNTFLGPIYATGITLFYYDQRVRKEGYDIEWMMQAAGMTAPVQPTARPAQAPAADTWPAVDAHFGAALSAEPQREPEDRESGDE